MKTLSKILILLLYTFLVTTTVFAQQSAILTYGSSAKSASTKSKITSIIGQPLVGESVDPVKFNYSLSLGFWGILRLPPLSPYVFASDGDFTNRIEINWSLDPLSPPAKDGYKVYRDNSFIAELSPTTESYQDYNVIAGSIYEYELLGVNEYGDGSLGYDVGFMNPNGVITGNVTTTQGTASTETEVYLDPSPGKSLKLFGNENISVSLYELYETKVDSVLESFGLSKEMTLEIWFYANSDGTIFFSGDIDSINTDIKLTTENKIGLEFPTASLETSEIEFEKWTHLAITVNSSNIQVYLNGELDVSMDNPDENLASHILSGDISFGAETWRGLDSAKNFFTGYLDDMRIWTTTRSREEIIKNMQRTADVDEDGLLAYWKFDEGNGTITFDQTDHNWDGIINGASYSSETPGIKTSAFTDEEGNFFIGGIYYNSGQTFKVIPQKETELGTSVKFDGDSYVAIEADSLLLDEEEFTISMWYKMNTGGSGEELFIQADPAKTYFHIFKHGTDQITARGQFGNDWIATERTDSKVIEADQWYYISAVYDKINLTMLIFNQDGSIYDSVSAATSNSRVFTDSVSSVIGLNLQGTIDEFMYWSSARTSSQLKEDLTGENITFDDDGNYEDPENEELIAYFKFNEGFDLLATDYSLNSISASLSVDDIWSDDIPLDEVFNHVYSPGFRYVTLNESNTSKDDVTFTDVSLLTVSGYVRFADTRCYADSIEILVDGASASPQIFTDENGKFVVELEPGSSALLTPSYGDFNFELDSYEVQNLSQPIAGIVFDITTTRELKGFVAGGSCKLGIAGTNQTVTLRIESQDGCYSTSTTVNENGTYHLYDLPPLDYYAFVEHDSTNIQEYFDNLGGIAFSLRNQSDSLDFLYYSDLQVELSFPNYLFECDYIFDQGDSVLVRAKIFEDYPGGNCDTEFGQLTIRNKIGDAEDAILEFTDGQADFYIQIGQPNTLSGGDYPYKKLLQVTAEDSIGRKTTDEVWAYVTGIKQAENTFTTVTPEIPTIVLRDPPGDQSYAYLEEGYSTTSGVQIVANTAYGTSDQVYLGTEKGILIGLGYAEKLEFFAVAGPSVSYEGGDSKETLEIRTTVTSDAYSTNNLDGLLGNDGDIFIGAAFVLQFGTGLNLTVNNENGNCTVDLDTVTTVVPDTISTTFMYSESHLKNSVIPNLEFLLGQTPADSIEDLAYYATQIGLWNDILEMNDSLKDAAEFEKNISFDAGTVYDYTYTAQNDTADNDGKNYFTEDGLVLQIGWKNTISGYIEGYVYGSYTYEKVNIDESSGSRTIGYHFEDDDAGDFFSVNILNDEVYNTPVFETVSGQSSCPWEPGTRPRNGVSLSMGSYEATGVPPDEAATFSLYLGNTSQSDETQTYDLFVNQESNQNGAIVKVNGIAVEDHLSFTIPSGKQFESILTVEKGPGSYFSDTLQITFQSTCDAGTEIPDDVELSTVFTESAEFVVNWAEPCSNVEIFTPDDEWLLTSADNDSMQIVLTGYEKDNEDLDYISLQFRKKIIIPGSSVNFDSLGNIMLKSKSSVDDKLIPKANDWVNIVSISRDSLTNDDHEYIWDISGLIPEGQDGTYELRAITFCVDPNGYSGVSEILNGLVDRTGPALVGEPRPVDKILHVDDEVAFYFDEDIDCSLIDPIEDISFVYSDTDQDLNFEYTCVDNKIVFTPTDNNYFLEHEYLTATIKNIYDIYGNGDSETVYEWEFFVNRNPMHWEGLRIEESKLDDESIEIIRRLKNSGGENYTFEIIDIPEWLGVSPTEGTIGADKLETITFTVSNDVPHGYYADTVYAKTTDGNEPMVIMLDNLCNPPTWDVNEGDYQFSMTIIGNIQVDSAISEDLCDIVYAFVGDEVRGVAELQYFGEIESSASLEDVSPYQFYMTVYSNSEILNSEMLVLRVWDASERVVTTQSSDYYYFDPDALVGSTRSPDTIKTSNLALQETALDKGWNWISTNLVNDDMSLDYVLSFLTTTQDYIKGHNYFASNETGSWVGSLTELSANNSYMIQMSIEDTIQYFGEAVNLDSAFIPLDSNWNWIGYHPTSAQDLNSALISLNPAEGDLIKNQSYFSTYIEDVGWVGSLKEMVPGDGYKLQISQKDTLIYPEPVLSKSLSKIAGTANNKGETDLETSASVDWQVNPSHFEFNMNLIGHFDQSQFANLNANDLLGAFVGDECRGLIAPIYIESLDEYRIFLTVFSNNAVGDTVTFKLYDSKNDATLDIKNSVTFSSNKIIGSTNDPFLFTIFVTGIHSTGLIPEVFSLSQNYPNPFNPETIIEFGLPEAANVQIQVFNILGELVNTVTSREFDAGYYMVRWLGEDNYGSKLSSGTYIYRIVARYNKDTFSETRKMILLK